MCLDDCLTDLVLRLSIFSVDQQILQHMIDTQAEFIMEVTDKTKADVKVICVYYQATPDWLNSFVRPGWYSHRL